MKDEIKDFVFEDTYTGKRYTSKMTKLEEGEIVLKLYDKPSLIRKLKYVGLNADSDNAKITYKQIV